MMVFVCGLKKDVVGALANACKKAGIKFCIYYSV
jgi:alpha-L-fucosidase